MLQQEKPDDFVIATGRQFSVREFIQLAAKELDMDISWSGEGVNEKAIWKNIDDNSQKEKVIIKVDERYFRPAEVDSLLGDPSKANNKLGWKPKISFEDLVKEMVIEDLESAKKDKIIRSHGYKTPNFKD